MGVADTFGLLGRFGRGLGSMEFGGSPSGSPDMSMSSPRDFLDDGSDGNVFDVESDGDVLDDLDDTKRLVQVGDRQKR